MRLRVCSVHGVRDSRKFASLYSRWSDDNATWIRVKQLLCADAYTTLMGLFQDSDFSSSSNVFACSMCGTDASTSLNGTYVTAYLPNRPETEFAIPTCDSCTSKLHECLLVGAEPLPDRGNGAGAASLEAPADDPWSTLP